jgi:hypothetical protein
MRFEANIACDNAAFAGDDDSLGNRHGGIIYHAQASANREVARILRELAARVEGGELDLPYGMRSFTRTLFDVNGNDVGRATYRR